MISSTPEKKDDVAKQIIDLFDDYRHYKAMTANFFTAVFMNDGINFKDFMWWLKQRK